MEAAQLAEAITLKVLADAPDARGPFILEAGRSISADHARRVQEVWERAFRYAGRVPPPLIILDAGMRIEPMPATAMSGLE